MNEGEKEEEENYYFLFQLLSYNIFIIIYY